MTSRFSHRANRHDSGFSVVELLIAMALGLVLISGMLAVFMANKRSSSLNEATANMQESVRFVLSELADDIRMAGHQGCAALDGGAAVVQAANVPMNDPSLALAATAVSGAIVRSANSWTPALPLGTPPVGFSIPADRPATVDTHALALQFGRANTAGLVDQMNVGSVPSRSAPLRIDTDLELKAGDLAIVSDCLGADLFAVSTATPIGLPNAQTGQQLTHAAPANSSGNLSIAYGAPPTIDQTRVMQFASNVYFIAETDQTNTSGDAISGLYQQTFPFNDPDNPPVLLARGIENMRLSFGVENAFGTLQYVTPDAVTNSADIRAVRIGFLMHSIERIAAQDDDITYVLAGQPIAPATGATSDGSTHPSDRRFRLAFNTTVKVRNYR